VATTCLRTCYTLTHVNLCASYQLDATLWCPCTYSPFWVSIWNKLRVQRDRRTHFFKPRVLNKKNVVYLSTVWDYTIIASSLQCLLCQDRLLQHCTILRCLTIRLHLIYLLPNIHCFFFSQARSFARSSFI